MKSLRTTRDVKVTVTFSDVILWRLWSCYISYGLSSTSNWNCTRWRLVLPRLWTGIIITEQYFITLNNNLYIIFVVFCHHTEIVFEEVLYLFLFSGFAFPPPALKIGQAPHFHLRSSFQHTKEPTKKNSFSSKVLFHYFLSPTVTMSSF